MSNADLARLFLLQFACLLVACRGVGWIAGRLRQPQVVAEMVTGILLGPSLFGLLAPEWQAALFPPQSMATLYVMSELGIVLYMLLVGLEFETTLLSVQLKSVLAISLGGTVVPLALGAGLSLWLVRVGGLFGPAVSPWLAALYTGAAMSVTAFPVLARILQDRGIAGTRLGALTLGAGACADVAAWCLLAVVLAAFTSDPAIAIRAVAGGIGYVLVVRYVARPLYARLGRRTELSGGFDAATLSTVLLGTAVGSWFTEHIGIHAVFGAFVLGLAMPRGLFADELKRTLHTVTTHIILPLFFVYSGLNTRIGLLTSPGLWALAAVVVVAASAGKGIACWAAARLSGHGQHDALAIGTLMNARGLMELVVLNIGLERGLITPTFFTIMVLMAIVTTVAAGPLFGLVYRPERLGARVANLAAR